METNSPRSYDINFAFNRRYVIDYQTLDTITFYILSGAQIGSNIFEEPAQYINSIYVYPFNLSNFIDIGSEKQNIIFGTDTTSFMGYRISRSDNQPLTSICLGYTYIGEYYHNFIDYKYTTLNLYLPYSNIIELDIQTFMKRVLVLNASLDFETGILNFYILRSTLEYEDEETALNAIHSISTLNIFTEIMRTVQVSIGAKISVGSNSANSLALSTTLQQISNIGNLVGAGANLFTGVLTGNPFAISSGISGTVSSVTGAVNTIMQAQVNTVQKGDKPAGNIANFIADYYPKIIYQRPQISQDFDYASYRKYNGAPLLEMRQLSSLTGFTILDNFHLENIPATSSELDMLDSQLRSGIIL